MKNGSYYSGDWKDGQPHGIGKTYSVEKQQTYEGEFQNGERIGKGVEKVEGEQRQIREGFWKNNRMKGEGRVIIFSHTTMQSKLPHGRKLLEGAVLEYYGGLTNDKFHGRGELLTNHGKWYVGEFKDGQKNGTGVLYLSSAYGQIGQYYTRYEGQFKQEMYHGQGKLLHENGNVYEG